MPDEVSADPVVVVQAAYGALCRWVAAMDDARSWRPTACTGWSGRDLVAHCLIDARRGLVALHSPAEGPADRDAVSYWGQWAEDETGAASGRRFVRVLASLYLSPDQLREEFLGTAGALRHAAAAADPGMLVGTQGFVLSIADLLRTLAVEASIHHLDLLVGPSAGEPGPSPEGLAEVRRTLDGLLGRSAPASWDDTRYARLATGRAELTADERAELAAAADRLPLLS